MSYKENNPANAFNLSGKSPEELGYQLLKLFKDAEKRERALTEQDVAQATVLIEAGADLAVRDEIATEPLLYAVCMREMALVALMLEKGANVDAQNNAGNTAMSVAAAFMDEDMIALLLSAKPNLLIRDGSGNTPLRNAQIFEKNGNVIYMLKKAQIDYQRMLKKAAAGLPLENALRVKKLNPKK